MLRDREASNGRLRVLGVGGEPLHATDPGSGALLSHHIEMHPPRHQAALRAAREQRELGARQARRLRNRHRAAGRRRRRSKRQRRR